VHLKSECTDPLDVFLEALDHNGAITHWDVHLHSDAIDRGTSALKLLCQSVDGIGFVFFPTSHRASAIVVVEKLAARTCSARLLKCNCNKVRHIRVPYRIFKIPITIL